uniref:Uncharacterized protein LOC114346749 isoform X1 n=1 Tax=Diabrotica virgifera virgifera TaxID=50390 RepID=A0A6P7GU68_DIAVI
MLCTLNTGDIVDTNTFKADTLLDHTIKSTTLGSGVRVHIPEVINLKENHELSRNQFPDSVEENAILPSIDKVSFDVSNNKNLSNLKNTSQSKCTNLETSKEKRAGESAKRKLFFETGRYPKREKIQILSDILMKQSDNTNIPVNNNLLYTGLCYL